MSDENSELTSGRPVNALNSKFNFNVVLVEPEIPQNTGNVGRTCVALNTKLHLVAPLGFKITDRNLKRAGLDYWQHLWWTQHTNFESWENQVPDPSRVFYFSTKAKKSLYDAQFKIGDWLVFGRETKGLPPELLRRNEGQTLQIPQLGPVRSLNMATAVAIALYEAFRQNQGGQKQ
jgi:tRNA (cytidine/uridine-2'-O-)-methyltransferase